MVLQLSAVNTDADFDVLIPLLWLSYGSPRIPFLPLLFAAEDESADALDKAVQRSKERLMQMHHADASSHWFKVTDTSTNTVIAGARWHVHETNPYSKLPERPLVVAYWPEGDRRNYASMSISQIVLPRMKRYREPHLSLQLCFTHPDYRNRGAGKLIMEWGVRIADSLGINAYVEATEMGKHLYAKFGFIMVSKDEVNTSVPNPSEEWKDMQKRFQPIPWYCMWRPICGIYEPEKMCLPW